MKTGALALLLLTPALAGCLGGSDDALAPSAAEGAGEVPTLPEGLAMEGAEVVEYTDRAVTWRWESTVGPGITGNPDGPATTFTSFDVPAGTGLALEADLTWPEGLSDDLGATIRDHEGRTVCTGPPSAFVLWPSLHPASPCSSMEEALDEPAEWSVEVYAKTTDGGSVPFELELRVAATDRPELNVVAEILPFEASAEDGTALRGHVYLPDAEAPFATILELSGYWGMLGSDGPSDEQTTQDGDRTTLDGWLGPFMDAGFAVALVNIRGTGLSGGCQDYMGPRDVSDAATVVKSLADEPWSNGRVGMIGHSWPAVSAYTAMASDAPALKAVAPDAGVVDLWSEETYNGAFRTDTPQAWVYEGLAPPSPGRPAASHDACPERPRDLVDDGLLAADGDRTAWFEQRDLRPAIANATAAAFVSHGLANGESVPLRDPGLWDRIPHMNKTFWLGQWTHNAGPTRADYLHALVDWFGHHLRDEPAQVEAGIVEFQDTAGTWHTSTAWPPAGGEVRLHLSHGRLVADRDRVVSSQAPFASSNQRAIPDACADKALFVSPPLAEDVVIAGVFTANVTVSSTLPDGNFAANLWHVDEPWACGQAPGTQGVSGVRYADPSRGLQKYELGFALSDLRHRGHLDVGSQFPTDEPDVMRMTSESFATFVSAGERLVLAIGGGDPWLLEDPRKPVLTVHTGPEVEGEIVLNVVEGNLTFEDDGSTAAWVVTGVAS